MNDTYQFRGWFWAGLSALSLVALIVHAAAGLGLVALTEDVTRAAIGGLGFLYHRRLDPKVWEEQYGVADERENLIRGRAARMTLKLMAVLLYGGSGLIPNTAVQYTLLAVLVLGGVLWLALKRVFAARM